MMDGQQHSGSSQTQSSGSTKATFSGMTALVGIFSLIISIVSVAVPYWGYYAPAGASYFSSGTSKMTSQKISHYKPWFLTLFPTI
jgi:hypothetical protein